MLEMWTRGVILSCFVDMQKSQKTLDSNRYIDSEDFKD